MSEFKLDSSRRIHIPKDFLKKLGIKRSEISITPIEITIEYGKICMRPFDNKCIEKRPYIGIVRYMNYQGNICIPCEYCNILKISYGIVFDIVFDTSKIILVPKNQG